MTDRKFGDPNIFNLCSNCTENTFTYMYNTCSFLSELIFQQLFHHSNLQHNISSLKYVFLHHSSLLAMFAVSPYFNTFLQCLHVHVQIYIQSCLIFPFSVQMQGFSDVSAHLFVFVKFPGTWIHPMDSSQSVSCCTIRHRHSWRSALVLCNILPPSLSSSLSVFPEDCWWFMDLHSYSYTVICVV